ncbi:outer membrane protein assembly factor BamE [Psychrobacter sp. NPDC078370]|jgi:outer membrane protein assembly factor BamE (lipoprotein component of BamABCDE complex)|uniref:outer membrane protein assembly factor BamE n=1 Tax=unclassified Psychrobacter TaxID=196806 RepID=UPI003D073E67|tara:strand:+ start:1629 stop:2093 length:465 start_codon:yes stop_codon:yes gene_type:complete
MKKSVYHYCLLATTALLFTMTGCSQKNILPTWHLTPGAQHGSVDADSLVFPDPNKAWQKGGTIVNHDDVAKISVGTTKDEIYKLIGTPHFSEGFNAREWDYILKFYNTDNEVEVCQYKIIFDDSYEGRMRDDEFFATEFYWLPASCEKYSELAR